VTNGKYFSIEDSPLTTGKKHLHQQMSINNNNISNLSSANYNNASNNRIPVIANINMGAKNEYSGSFNSSSPVTTPPLLQGRAQSPKIKSTSASIFGSPSNNNYPDSGSGIGNTSNSTSNNNLNGYANSMNGLGNISSQGGSTLFKTVSFKRHEASFQQEDGNKGDGIFGNTNNNNNNNSLAGSFLASHPKNASSNSDSISGNKSYFLADSDGSMAVASSPSTTISQSTHSVPNSIIANANLYTNRPATSGSINLKGNNDFLSMSSNLPLTSSLPSAAINHLASTLHNGTPSLFKSHYSQQGHHNHHTSNGGHGNGLASSDYKQSSHTSTASPSKIGYGWVDRVK